MIKHQATLLYVAERQKAAAEDKGRITKGIMAHYIAKALRLYCISMDITRDLIEKRYESKKFILF